MVIRIIKMLHIQSVVFYDGFKFRFLLSVVYHHRHFQGLPFERLFIHLDLDQMIPWASISLSTARITGNPYFKMKQKQ